MPYTVTFYTHSGYFSLQSNFSGIMFSSALSSLDLQGGMLGVSANEFPNKVFTLDKVQFYSKA